MTGRGLEGRRFARALIVGALVFDGIVAVVLLSQPQGIGPTFAVPPSPSIADLCLAIGLILNVLGLAWMVRILRADPEAHPSWWRAVRGR